MSDKVTPQRVKPLAHIVELRMPGNPRHQDVMAFRTKYWKKYVAIMEGDGFECIVTEYPFPAQQSAPAPEVETVGYRVTYEYRPRKDCQWVKRDDASNFKSDVSAMIVDMARQPETYRNISDLQPLMLVSDHITALATKERECEELRGIHNHQKYDILTYREELAALRSENEKLRGVVEAAKGLLSETLTTEDQSIFARIEQFLAALSKGESHE